MESLDDCLKVAIESPSGYQAFCINRKGEVRKS